MVCIIYKVISMRIRVSALGKIGSVLDFEEVAAASQFPELTKIGLSQSPLELNGTVLKTELGFLVSGTVSMSLTLTCSRCLTAFEYPVKAEFSEEFVPGGKGDHSEADELGDAAPTFQGDCIDVSGLVAEAIIVEIPMKAVCREDCRGLCPECGQVLNDNQCKCKVVQPDPRLAVLADLLKNQ
jgi:uncharacterized protein